MAAGISEPQQRSQRDGLVATGMRLVWRTDPQNNPDAKAHVDREFIGVDQQDLHLQIKYWIQKFGICEAYNLAVKENTDGNEATSVSEEKTSEEIKEKG